MDISIIGIGYVGTVTGICFAELGHRVIFVDIDPTKIKAINEGIPPLHEPDLENLIKRNRERISATFDIEYAIKQTSCTFICVNTPSNKDGSINLEHIIEVIEEIGVIVSIKNTFHTIVIKSSVIPGTIEEIILPILEKLSNKKAFSEFGLAANPEFLKEGSTVSEFFETDRIVFGVNDEKSLALLKTLYLSFKCPKLITDIRTAEMIKYTSNAFLATKISFVNEIGNLCKKMGIDAFKVFKGVGLDKRIGSQFFRSGIGFGGSCLPKDIRALIYFASQKGIKPHLLHSVLDINEIQPLKMVSLLKTHKSKLDGLKIGILGLAFKPSTDGLCRIPQ